MKHFIISWNLLSQKRKNYFLLIICLFVFLSLLEVIGIASVIPFVTALFSPSSLESIPVLKNYSNFLEDKKDSLVPIFCIIFFLIFLFKNIFFVITYKFIYIFLSTLRADISSKILEKYLHQDFLFFSRNHQGKLSAILGPESQNFTDNFFFSLMVIISEFIILVGIFALIIITNQTEGFLFIIPVILISTLVVRLLNRKIKKWAQKRFQVAEDLATLAQRIFIGIRDLYLSNNADEIIKKYRSFNLDQGKLDANNQTVQMIPKALLEIAGLIILLSLIVYLNHMNIQSDTILTNLTFYFVVAYRAIPSFNKILIQYQRIKYSKNSVDIVNSIFKLENQRTLKIDYTKNEIFKKNIKFENVNFGYDKARPLIKNLNLEIEKGQIIGLYGESGSGKSTILNLLTTLIEPDQGKIFLDNNILVSDGEKRNFQNKITFISQDTFLWEDSIKNNIILNNEKNFDQEKFRFAANFAKVDKFINQFDNMYDYKVGSHSRRISSGQRQRIALSRAIYNLREILILDEATNAVDEKTEKEIFENIYNLKENKTVIIVSHNKKNLEKCDKTYEVNDNSIKEIT